VRRDFVIGLRGRVLRHMIYVAQRVLISLVCLVVVSGCSVMSSDLRITEVAVTTSISIANRPMNPVTVVPSDEKKLYVTLVPRGVSEEVEVSVEWFFVDGDTVIDRSSVFISEDKQIAFSLSSPESGWPRGNYAARVFVGKEVSPRVVSTFMVF